MSVRINTLLLRRVAEEKGFSAAKISRAADLGYTTVYNIWEGTTQNPNLQTIAAIARVLGLRAVDLIIEDEQESSLNNKVPLLRAA